MRDRSPHRRFATLGLQSSPAFIPYQVTDILRIVHQDDIPFLNVLVLHGARLRLGAFRGDVLPSRGHGATDTPLSRWDLWLARESVLTFMSDSLYQVEPTFHIGGVRGSSSL